MKNIIFLIVAFTAIVLMHYGASIEDKGVMILGIILGVPTVLMSIYKDEVFR